MVRLCCLIVERETPEHKEKVLQIFVVKGQFSALALESQRRGGYLAKQFIG